MCIYNCGGFTYSGRDHTVIQDGVVVIRRRGSRRQTSPSTASGQIMTMANILMIVIMKICMMQPRSVTHFLCPNYIILIVYYLFIYFVKEETYYLDSIQLKSFDLE